VIGSEASHSLSLGPTTTELARYLIERKSTLPLGYQKGFNINNKHILMLSPSGYTSNTPKDLCD